VVPKEKNPVYTREVSGYAVQKGKIFLRLVLLFSLVYFSGGILSPPLAVFWRRTGSARAAPALDTENGMGGGSYLEGGPNAAALLPASDPALEGLPEPEEFSKPRVLLYSGYRVEKGDTIGEIAQKFGLNQDTLISVNNIKSSRLLQIGHVLKIPNQDGILLLTGPGDSLSALAEKYGTDTGSIQTANELFSDVLRVNASLFIPGARLERLSLQEINGDLFSWPLAGGFISSPYGYRTSPFSKTRQFHSGLDIAAAMGTPVRAAMPGRVSAVAYDETFGNYVVITHHSGYRTLYAHLSVIRAKAGAYVETGERIGDVGSSGLSTGPHLHFTVYKDGVTVNPRNLLK
jgi:murein DD-endopeptidase MepM/ murein hydrolase activator NlpD